MRGWRGGDFLTPSRPLCDQIGETMHHLLTDCSFFRSIWYGVMSWIRSTAGPTVEEDDFVEWWLVAIRYARA
jgi:hypothetical protein